MGKLIKGTHHIAVRCGNAEEFEKTMELYTDILGMEVVRAWGEGEARGVMLSTGNSMMEVFASGKTSESTGTVNHFALAADDVDACIDAVKKAGCRIKMEPKDIVIQSAVPFPARIAFCYGHAGEEIEFFCEK